VFFDLRARWGRVRSGFVLKRTFAVNVNRVNDLAGFWRRGTPPPEFPECGEERRPGVDELRFACGEVVGEPGVFEQAVGGEAELKAFRGGGAMLTEGFLAGGEFLIEDGGVDQENALETPFDAGELADEVVLDVVLGEEDAGEAFDEALEGDVVFMAQDEDGACVAAVFEGVEAGAGLAFGRFGAAAFGTWFFAHGVKLASRGDFTGRGATPRHHGGGWRAKVVRQERHRCGEKK